MATARLALGGSGGCGGISLRGRMLACGGGFFGGRLDRLDAFSVDFSFSVDGSHFQMKIRMIVMRMIFQSIDKYRTALVRLPLVRPDRLNLPTNNLPLDSC